MGLEITTASAGELSGIRTALGVVSLAGNDSIGGNKAFTSTTRPTSAGTGTPASTSLVTRGDMDTRLAALEHYFSHLAADGNTVSNSTTLADSGLTALTLPVGVYQVHCNLFFTSGTSTNGGMKIALTKSGSGTATGYLWMSMANFGGTVGGTTFAADSLLYGTGSTQNGYGYNITGLVVVTTDSVVLTPQHALNSTDAAVPTRTTKAGSYIRAIRIS